MATTCTMKDLYQSTEFCNGQIVQPGIVARVYGIPYNQIITWPTIDRTDSTSDTVTSESIVKYAGDFTLAADATWRFIDVVGEKSKVTFEAQGEEPCKSFINKAELVLAGTTATIKANCAVINNSRMVWAVQMVTGEFVLIGCKNFRGAKTASIAGDSGAAPTDAHTTTISIEASDFIALPLYPGKIETEDGDISGEDGSPITPA